MACINDVVQGLDWGIPITFNTRALSSSAAAAGELSGYGIVVMNNSGGTPGTYTTRTATQMIADSNLSLGQKWLLILVNGQGTGTLTLAAGSGVTLSGTATVAAITARFYGCQVTNVVTPAITIGVIGTNFSFTATGLAFGV